MPSTGDGSFSDKLVSLASQEGVGHDDGDHDHENEHDHEIDGYVAHLPLLHIDLIFDLVGGSNRKTTCARDHVPLL